MQDLEQEHMEDVQLVPEVQVEAVEHQGDDLEIVDLNPATPGSDGPQGQEVEEVQQLLSPSPMPQGAEGEVKPPTAGEDIETSKASREQGLNKQTAPSSHQEVQPAEKRTLRSSSPLPNPFDETKQKSKKPVQEVITVKLRKRAQKAQEEKPSRDGERRAEETTPDSSIQLARAALASKKGAPKRLSDPPISPRRTRGGSGSLQLSATPEFEDASIQLARAALTSPSKLSVESESTPPGALKAELSKRLRTQLPKFTALKNIRNHANKHVGVVAVATTQPPQPQRAKRQYTMSLNVTDPSLVPNHVTEVQFSRAHKEYLPSVKPGDAIILKGFQVVQLAKKGFGLVADDDSSWAVFDNEEGEPEIKGEPMDLDEVESDHAMSLRSWYGSLDGPTRARLDKANQKIAEENRPK